jgi:hypothetical protein
MSDPFSRATRGQLRIWLKWAVESAVLDRLPPRYEGEGSGSLQSPEVYARALLDEMRNLDTGPRSPEEILADVRRFRMWLEGRQKISRQIILADPRGSASPMEDTPAQLRRDQRRRSSTSQAERLSYPHPRENPMWDDWLDG